MAKLYYQRLQREGIVKGEQQFPQCPGKVQIERFIIRAGAPCEVTSVFRTNWIKHVTTKATGFEKFERYDGKTKCYEFRLHGWLMRVHRRHVEHREDKL